MIIVELIAGLGNQLFQYAYGRKLSLSHCLPLKFDVTFFNSEQYKNVFRLDKFKVHLEYADDQEIKKLKRIPQKVFFNPLYWRIFGGPYCKNNKWHVDEKTFRVDKFKLKNSKQLYLSGYWQSDNYFKDKTEIIREDFTLREPLNDDNLKIMSMMVESNSISIHIRRADYIHNSFFLNLPTEYYQKAMKLIVKNVEDPLFFIFSDDLDWVKDNLSINANTVYVDVNDSKTDYMDLILMSTCKHNIIANSTFSWWGAWLNRNQKKIIISPRIWYSDGKHQRYIEKTQLLPKSWLKI